ncbi:hypothetical protein DFH09DRAFT_1304518 [Mycena vulgaris]|nr:hypothetical protein DFH09DRAFT_1304518 [Mycena vulgaris]
MLDNAYVRAIETLRQEDSDPLRYKLLSSNIIDNLIPVLEGLEAEVPRVWIDECANIFGPLVYELQVSALAAEGMQVVERDNIELLQPVSEEQTGKRGRPRKHIDPEYLKEATATNRNIKSGALADAVGVHRHTLRKRMRELGVEKRFDDLDDDELDAITHTLIPQLPRSTRNTRIERLWVEVGTQFARRWRAFFTRLGRIHGLDRKNPGHLWLLHRLFLTELNDDCHEFQDEWNLHPISGRMTSDQSPADLRFLGQTTEGIYRHDPLDGIHPDAISRYYGVAEEDSDPEEATAEEQLENQIEADLAQNIRHQPVKVARHHSPFEEHQSEDDFLDLLDALLAQPGMLPEDYGILEDEWEEEDYPEIEIIRPGTSGKEMVVILPRTEWFPRAARWAQALDLLTRCLHELEGAGSDEESSNNGDLSDSGDDSD